jgi:uncharacterized protein YpbB
MFHYILLVCIKYIKSERSINNIYYLLKGKKSTQTIQDAYLFQLTNFFGIYPQVEKNTFNNFVTQLLNNQLIKHVKNDFVIITTYGETYLNNNKRPLYFNGLNYNKIDRAYLQSIILLIQTTTNLANGNNRFIPVIEDYQVQKIVKKVLQTKLNNPEVICSSVYKDLHTLLDSYNGDDRVKEMFVMYLTSNNEIGHSMQQLAETYKMSIEDVYCELMNLIHYQLSEIEQNRSAFLFLPNLIGTKNVELLTDSAKRTYELLLKSHTVKEISQIRLLKENTIYDHIVEIAYQFPVNIYHYMSVEVYEKIRYVLDELHTTKLKELKSKLPNSVTYFQIKLAIAITYRNRNEE